MALRFALLAALVLVAESQPPPMFSPWYMESLRGILDLEEPAVARLSSQRNPRRVLR